MTDRDYKYIDMEKVNESIANGEVEPADDEPVNVLYETLLDLLQLAQEEGMTEEEIDSVVRRVNDYRASRVRNRFRLHTGDGNAGNIN